jgi:dATP pyrophosphohydrolase
MKKLQKIQIILFREKRKKLEFLLLKREGLQRSWWQGITGGVEEFDETLKDACVRELNEEINFQTANDKIIGPLNQFEFVTKRKGYEGQTATEYIFAIELPVDFKPILNDEHSEFKWLGFEEAINLIDFKESKDVVKMISNKYHC